VVGLGDVQEFSRQLGAFLEAGIPMLDALETVRDQIGSPEMAAVVDEILAGVRRGLSFTNALNEHPKVFPAYYRAIIRSADFTGQLDVVLQQLTTYLERDLAARRQLKSALAYPMMVMIVAALGVTAMTMFVLPKFTALYRSLGAELPLPTRMLLAFTEFTSAYWWLLFVVGLTAVIVGLAVLGGNRGKRRRDVVLLRLPVLGELVHIIAIERFARVLAALTSAGVPLPDAIQVASGATNSSVFDERISEVRDTLLRGGGLSQPMEESALFPLPALQMVRVGERTGTLSAQLGKAATYYEREVTFRIKRATDLFQPLVILGVGLVVGFVAIAQVAAMYSIFGKVK
jgi:type IV pilus assembly protein PilC